MKTLVIGAQGGRGTAQAQAQAYNGRHHRIAIAALENGAGCGLRKAREGLSDRLTQALFHPGRCIGSDVRNRRLRAEPGHAFTPAD